MLVDVLVVGDGMLPSGKTPCEQASEGDAKRKREGHEIASHHGAVSKQATVQELKFGYVTQEGMAALFGPKPTASPPATKAPTGSHGLYIDCCKCLGALVYMLACTFMLQGQHMDDCNLQKDKLERELADLRPNNVATPQSKVAPVEQPVQEIQTSVWARLSMCWRVLSCCRRDTWTTASSRKTNWKVSSQTYDPTMWPIRIP